MLRPPAALSPIPLILCTLLACGDSPDEATRRAAAVREIEGLSVEAREITTALIRDHFPGLAGVEIVIKPSLSTDIFLATDVEIDTVFRDPRERTYVLYLSPVLVRNPPGRIALEGILAHELAHFADYLEMGPLDLGLLLAGVTFSEDYTTRYERGTDRKTLELGFAPGLRAYRVWIYDRLSDPAQLAKKKRIYYRPEEIDAWVRDRNSPTIMLKK